MCGRGKGCSLYVCVFKRKRSVIEWLLFILSLFVNVCVCKSNERKEENFGGRCEQTEMCV